MLDEARALDPERPFVLSGDIGGCGDFVSEVAVHYGSSVQMTGREAWYHPWWAGLGYVAGFYGAGEPSATTHAAALSRMLGWILIDGDSNHNLFWDIEDYMREEKTNGWFTRNQRLMALFGKSLRARPGIVILRSARTHRLGSPLPWNWDIGRGELQAAHYDNVYATEREVLLGLAYNTTDAELQTDVAFQVSIKPETVWDMVTHEPMRFTTGPEGWVRVKGVEFKGQGVRVFGVKRTDLSGGLPFWWQEKVKYWKRTPGQPTPRAIPPVVKLPATVTFEEWRFLADKDGTIGTKPHWLRTGFDD